MKQGGLWVPDTSNGWGAGKQIFFPGSTDTATNQPDSEGLTVGPDGALYVTTERNNAANDDPAELGPALRPDPAGRLLVATDQWDLTAEFPELHAGNKTEANLGFEGVTFVPDSYLVANGFVDASTGATYNAEHLPAARHRPVLRGAGERRQALRLRPQHRPHVPPGRGRRHRHGPRHGRAVRRRRQADLGAVRQHLRCHVDRAQGELDRHDRPRRRVQQAGEPARDNSRASPWRRARPASTAPRRSSGPTTGSGARAWARPARGTRSTAAGSPATWAWAARACRRDRPRGIAARSTPPGHEVTYAGKVFRAQWWTSGEVPGRHGVRLLGGARDGRRRHRDLDALAGLHHRRRGRPQRHEVQGHVVDAQPGSRRRRRPVDRDSGARPGRLLPRVERGDRLRRRREGDLPRSHVPGAVVDRPASTPGTAGSAWKLLA